MIKHVLAVLALLATTLPASAQPQHFFQSPAVVQPAPQPVPSSPPPKPVIADKHPRLKAIYRAPLFVVIHPVQTFNRLTFPVQHPLKTGKWMEASGFNGLMGGLGAIGNVGTTAIVGAKKF